MPIPDRFTKIVDMLAVATAGKKLDWKEGADACPFAAFSGIAVRIREKSPPGILASIFSSRDEPPPRELEVEVQVLNEKGNFVDGFSIPLSDVDFGKLRQLHRDAIRISRNAEQKLSLLEGQLAAKIGMMPEPETPKILPAQGKEAGTND